MERQQTTADIEIVSGGEHAPKISGEKVFRFLELSGFLKLKENKDEFEKRIQNLSFDDFNSFVKRLNGIIRLKNLSERNYDGDNVAISSKMFGTAYLPPSPNIKFKLFEEGFEAIKNISGEDRQALTFYLLQYIHLFNDGNGRTGRLLYELLFDKDITIDSLKVLLDHKNNSSGSNEVGRNKMNETTMKPADLDQYLDYLTALKVTGNDFVREYSRVSGSEMVGGIKFEDKSEGSLLKTQIEQILNETRFGLGSGNIVLARMKERFPNLESYYETKEFPNKKSILRVRASEMLDQMNIDDLNKVLVLNDEVKTVFIQTLIDIFKNPSEFTFPNGDGTSSTLLDKIKLRK